MLHGPEGCAVVFQTYIVCYFRRVVQCGSDMALLSGGACHNFDGTVLQKLAMRAAVSSFRRTLRPSCICFQYLHLTLGAAFCGGLQLVSNSAITMGHVGVAAGGVHTLSSGLC